MVAYLPPEKQIIPMKTIPKVTIEGEKVGSIQSARKSVIPKISTSQQNVNAAIKGTWRVNVTGDVAAEDLATITQSLSVPLITVVKGFGCPKILRSFVPLRLTHGS